MEHKLNLIYDAVFFIFIAVLLLSTIIFFQNVAYHNKEMDKLNKIEKQIQERNYTDSLYHNHISKCAFVSKYELEMDSRGYFYSKYKRNPNGR